MLNRLDPQALQERLRRDGVWSKKYLGQHFLVDQSVLETILQTAQPLPGDTVVEIGPGPGGLTEALLATEAHVVAFEYDASFVQLLKQDFAQEIKQARLTVVPGDALQTLPSFLQAEGRPYAVVANIPYQITTPLLELFLERKDVPSPTSLTLLVQREVAERIAAPAATGERSFLSVLCQYYAVPKLIRVVPATAFWPAPEVQSAVLHLQVRSDRAYGNDEGREQQFLRFVKVAFTARRKQLKNVLAGIRGTSPAAIEDALTQLGLRRAVRAQELTEEQWRMLFEAQV